MRAFRRFDAGLPVKEEWVRKAAIFQMKHELITRTTLTLRDIAEMPKWEVSLHYDMLQKTQSEPSES